jgi:hypothetical protein
MTSAVKNLIANKHPWSKLITVVDPPIEAPEFVIDNIITAGAVAITGFRGIGKTS